MAFHLEKPYINNIGNSKRKPSAKQQKAQAEHEAWLRSRGLHLEQLSSKPRTPTRKLKQVITVDTSTQPCSNGFAPAGAKRSVFDSKWKKLYEDDPEMAKREAAAVAEAEAKSKRIAPAYSKGAYQYITGTTNLGDLGNKK